MNKLINIVLASLIGGSFVLFTQRTLHASEQNRISASVAQGKAEESATVSVSPYGIVLSFEELGESIEKYWATDDTYLRVGTNAPLGPEANILFLKTEGKWTENKNGTALTVKTKDLSNKSKTYSFIVEFTASKPKYTIIRIYPDEPSIPKIAPTVTEKSPPKSATEIDSEQQRVINPAPQSAVSPSPSPSPSPNTSSPKIPSKLIPSPKIPSKLIPSKLIPSPKIPSKLIPSKAKDKPLETQSPDSAKNYSSLSPASTRDNTSLEKPSTAKIQTGTPQNNSKQDISAILFSHTQANALIRGLAVATKTGEVGSKSIIVSKVQSIVRRLRRGENLNEAAKNESVEQKTISRLLQLGNYKNPDLNSQSLGLTPTTQN